MESNLKNLDWSFPQALKSMTDQDFNEYDVHTKKASITFLGRNITSTLGIQLFKVRNIWVFSPLVPSKPEKNIAVSFAWFVYSLRKVCLLFNFWMVKFTIMSEKQTIIVNFIIQKLKSKHTFLKKYTNWAKLLYFSLVLRGENKNKYFAPT